ncbi:hypothetical protein G7Y89_g13074 [Cudoniella acicularis]|uniref:Uncharacterized protein n=1 Tax=Cudoniella acicularis TaxID=354080 RepID=A0A8H4VZ19_9HELO|nr:hypothetical protein G7Y89_g13074 [Cudoniella acicularis]
MENPRRHTNALNCSTKSQKTPPPLSRTYLLPNRQFLIFPGKQTKKFIVLSKFISNPIMAKMPTTRIAEFFLLLLVVLVKQSQATETPQTATASQTSSPKTGFITSSTSQSKAANITANPGCFYIVSVINSCESATPGFTNKPSSDQQSCLCYSTGSGTTRTLEFNDAASTCASFVSTADPAEYSSISELQSFCQSPSSAASQPGTTASGFTTATSIVSIPTGTKSNAPTETVSSTASALPPVTGAIGIQNFTPQQIAGVSVGCGVVSLLAAYGCCGKRAVTTTNPKKIHNKSLPNEKMQRPGLQSPKSANIKTIHRKPLPNQKMQGPGLQSPKSINIEIEEATSPNAFLDK